MHYKFSLLAHSNSTKFRMTFEDTHQLQRVLIKMIFLSKENTFCVH